MATSRTFAQLRKQILLRAKHMGTGVEKMVRRAAIAADTALVMSTPVDTGRARANWRVSIGAPVLEETGFGGPSKHQRVKGAAANRRAATQAALDEGMAEGSRWRLGMGSIFITNNVPYIDALDKGSSAQAPKGMTVKAIAAAKRQLIAVQVLEG